MNHFLFLFSFIVSLNSFSQSTITIGTTLVEVDTVYTGLDIPWEIIYGPDDFIWTTERKGIVSRIDPTNNTKTIVLDKTSDVYQEFEAGMLGMILHPNFATTPEVFLAYTYEDDPEIKERIVKYTYNGTSLINEVILIDDIEGNSTHIGARFLILEDNTLIVSTGDAQNLSSPQNTTSLNGKLLRMNLDGSIPADNPIADSYVYTFGHRNIQGIAFGPSNQIYLSEHGASTDDEFQLLEAGRNYGWPNVEGFCDDSGELTFCSANNVMEPLTVWTPTIAPSDMVYYENLLFPEFHQRMLMTVLKDKKLIALELNEDGTSVVDEIHYLTDQFGRFRDICVGPEKEIYIATNGPFWSNTSPNTHSIIVLRPIDPLGIQSTDFIRPSIYPNPVKNEITLNVENQFLDSQLEISSLTGGIVYTGLISKNISNIDFSSLENGIYLLKITTPTGKVVTERIVK